jgi:ribosome-binding protein aMBF1 (putative translation factor)
LKGAVPLVDFVDDLEGDAEMAQRLAAARRRLATVLDDSTTFRRLRMLAGLSQARLAVLAGTTQTYIARVESGSLDPGTDMLARLASALGCDEVTVFRAVRAQREKKVS